MTRWVLHVDMDQFIAAIEVLGHPDRTRGGGDRVLGGSQLRDSLRNAVAHGSEALP